MNCVLWSSDHWVETSAWVQASPETTEATMVWLQANSEKTKTKLVWVQANPETTDTKLGNAQGLLQSCPIESAANNLQQPGKLKQSKKTDYFNPRCQAVNKGQVLEEQYLGKRSLRV